MTDFLDRIERQLETKLGDETVVFDDDDKRFHPQAVSFYNDSPSPDFAGFSKVSIFDTLLAFGECDDSRSYRIERKGDLVTFVNYDGDKSGAYNAVGQALECAAGSDAESVFIAQAMTRIVEDAAAPLLELMDKIRNTAACRSPAYEEVLKARIFVG